MPHISVVIPTYNEAQNIIPLIRQISRILKTEKAWEIIIVDDNSADKTGYTAQQFAKTHPHIHVLIRTKNPGLGLSIRDGIKYAKGDILIGMDADFNHDPKTIPLLLDGLKKADLVIASRFTKNGGMEDRARFMATFLFNTFLLLFGFPHTDNTSGFYAVKKQVIDAIGADRIYYGYGEYHLRLVSFTKRNGYSILQVPTYYKKRVFGNSKSQLIPMAVSYTKEAVRLAFS